MMIIKIEIVHCTHKWTSIFKTYRVTTYTIMKLYSYQQNNKRKNENKNKRNNIQRYVSSSKEMRIAEINILTNITRHNKRIINKTSTVIGWEYLNVRHITLYCHLEKNKGCSSKYSHRSEIKYYKLALLTVLMFISVSNRKLRRHKFKKH